MYTYDEAKIKKEQEVLYNQVANQMGASKEQVLIEDGTLSAFGFNSNPAEVQVKR